MTIEINTNLGLFIELENGIPVNHPVTGSNLSMFFPDFNPENPPAPFHKFNRRPMPRLGVFQKCTGVTYELVDGVYTDVYHISPMDPAERIAYLEKWLTLNPQPYPSWELNEIDLIWEAPTPRPDSDIKYVWDEGAKEWVTNDEYILRQRNTYLPADRRFMGQLETVSELPSTYTGLVNDAFLIIDTKTLYAWNGQGWFKWVGPFARLATQVIIDADVNGTPVKILGVLQNSSELNQNYTGDVADGYIIDDINEVHAWDGTKWVNAQVKESV